MAQALATLFDSDFLAKLERLEILARKVFRGQLRGEHTTRRRGRGIEFADFREYHPGDDVRYIDWHLAARLERLFVRLFAADEDLSLHLLLDVSASMAIGQPSKFDAARQVAAALAYIGLSNLDRVSVSSFAGSLEGRSQLFCNRHELGAVLRQLDAMSCLGSTDLVASARAFGGRRISPGVLVVISDFLGVDAPERGLDALRARGHDVMVIQLLAEDDIAPPLDGALLLVDAEDDSKLGVTVDARMRAIYAERLTVRLDGLERYSLERGMSYLRASTAVPFEDLILNYLRQGTLFR